MTNTTINLKELENMSIRELRALAKSEGLKSSGKKVDLFARLHKHFGFEVPAPVCEPVVAPLVPEEQAHVDEVEITSKWSTNAMYPALKVAYDTGNCKALDYVTCHACGVAEDSYKQWVLRVENLKDSATRLADAMHHRKQTSDADFKLCLDRVFADWKSCVHAGEKSTRHPNLWVAESDAYMLADFAWAFSFGDKVLGTQIAEVGKGVFRKHVEALIGTRMALCELLPYGDIQKLKAYANAKALMAKCDSRIPELEEQLANAKVNLESVQKDESARIRHFLVVAGLESRDDLYDDLYKQSVKAGAIASAKAEVERLEQSLKATKKNSTEAEDVVNANEAFYQSIKATRHGISL